MLQVYIILVFIVKSILLIFFYVLNQAFLSLWWSFLGGYAPVQNIISIISKYIASKNKIFNGLDHTESWNLQVRGVLIFQL